MAEDFSAYAAKVAVAFASERSPEEMRSLIGELLHKVAIDCVEEGTRLIGHIKCIAEIEPEKFVTCSVVSHDAKPRCAGSFERPSRSVELVINVLQYGLGKDVLEKIVEKESLRGFGPDAKVTIEDLSKKDDICEKPRLIAIG
ncbi:MAG: hypothetical protein LLG16_02075 [Euryarchaeota archaeon]|nr:hypothetical protein [Euryarchaeota archaeon]